MFNQAKLELRPSLRVAILLSIPCIASLILIVSAEIPLIFTLALICVHLFISFQFITRMALLSSPLSIQAIEIYQNKLYLQDKRGQRFVAQVLGGKILYPAFTLVSFKCEPVNNIDDIVTCNEQDKAGETNLNHEEMTTKSLSSALAFDARSASNKILFFIKDKIHAKSKRHLFICRYNALNSSDFRRIRIWLKFNN